MSVNRVGTIESQSRGAARIEWSSSPATSIFKIEQPRPRAPRHELPKHEIVAIKPQDSLGMEEEDIYAEKAPARQRSN
jgi:hypothetical protein